MSKNIAAVYLGGTAPNYKLMEQVWKSLEKRYNIVHLRGQNIEETLSDIINADLAIFILVEHGIPLADREDFNNVLIELGISVGAGVQTVVVGNAEKLAILEHPWVRTFSFQELLDIIDNDTDITYIPPTRINKEEENERTDRLKGL